MEPEGTLPVLFAFDDPFFGITTNVDFTTIYLEAKHNSQSFFLYSLHHILTKANETDEFKLRIEEGNSVVKYDTIHVSPTIGREDGTFGFAFFEYIPDRNEFIQQAIQEITRVKTVQGYPFRKIQEEKTLSDTLLFRGSPSPK